MPVRFGLSPFDPVSLEPQPARALASGAPKPTSISNAASPTSSLQSAPPSTTPPPRRQVHLSPSPSGPAAAIGLLAYTLRPARPTVLAISIFDNNVEAPQLELIGNAAPLRRPRNIQNFTALAHELDADYLLLGPLQNQPPPRLPLRHPPHPVSPSKPISKPIASSDNPPTSRHTMPPS